jgi:hypothetical protein
VFDDIAEARQRLTASLDEMRECTIRLRRWTAMYEALATDEDDADNELSEYARSADAPEELRKLQSVVDRRQLPWQDVVLGKADHVLDRGVRDYLAQCLDNLTVLGEAVRSGASPEEAATQVRLAMGHAAAPTAETSRGSVRR